MSKIVPPHTINEILERSDIVEIIASYIPLKQAGRNFKTTCPFHREKTPSFVVSPDKQIFHCFGCGEGGNALHFLTKYERLNFREALEILSKKTGVPLPTIDKRTSTQEQNVISELYRINEFACDFFARTLRTTKHPTAYKFIAVRKISQQTAQKFNLGLAPQSWDALLTYLRNKGINIRLIEKAGLIIEKEKGGYFDRFRNKLMIPIYNVKNKVVGFGSRVLDDSMPKYMNSPETPIYKKREVLFGLHLAKEHIRQNDEVVIAEGYFDVITPAQAGFGHIVASSGTALTTEQIRMLKRYTRNVILVFDADKAGELASLRSMDLFLEEEMNVRIATLPKGEDPDSFVRKFGLEKFVEEINSAHNVFSYKLGLLRSKSSKGNIAHKTNVAHEMLTTIKRIKNDILKSEYLKLLSEKLDIDEDALRAQLGKIKIWQSPHNEKPAATPKTLYQFPQAEKMLIKLILENIDCLHAIKNTISPSEIQNESLRNILTVIFRLYDTQKELKPNQLVSYLEDEGAVRIISELSSQETFSYKTDQKDSILAGCVKQIKRNTISLACKDLQVRIKTAQSCGNHEQISQLMQEFNTLWKQKENPV